MVADRDVTAPETQAESPPARRRWPIGEPALPDPSPGELLAAELQDAGEDRARRHYAELDGAEAAAFGAPVAVDRMSGLRESGTFAGAPDLTILASTREDKSTSDHYRVAVQRVRDAYAVAEMRLAAAADDALAGAWSVHDLARAAKATRRLAAQRRRTESLEQCVRGRWWIHRFQCRGCGQVHDGPPLTCNQRTCPACVPKLRAQNIAHVLELLEGVDQVRQQKGMRVPRWRFLTLTIKSFDEFLPMRRFMAKAWGKLIRHKFWTKNVGACVAVWETTHTAAGWHVHVHALIDAYLPRDVVVRAWGKVTEGLGEAVGVHLSEPKGGRKQIARELAKYVAKDLGGACSEQTAAWGVAGNPWRLAEFLDGSFRWRTLRTYGDCYDAAERLQAKGTLTCESCAGSMDYLESVWLTDDQVAALRSARRARVPASGSATAAAP